MCWDVLVIIKFADHYLWCKIHDTALAWENLPFISHKSLGATVGENLMLENIPYFFDYSVQCPHKSFFAELCHGILTFILCLWLHIIFIQFNERKVKGSLFLGCIVQVSHIPKVFYSVTDT